MGIGTYILVSLVKIAIALAILLTAVAYTTLLERKVVGHIQNRWGPSRVGPFGIWQPLADGLKFIFKEDITPPFANKPLYMLAPIIALTTALTSIAVIPIGPWIKLGIISTPLQIADVNIGLLIILGVTSVGVYGVALAGWSSNSKYSMLGGLRASAQTNRIPFDLPEAETELVAGYHTEYSSMKFAMFFMAEYANMVTVACLASVMFLGGW